MPAGIVTFVQVTFVLATFVHITNVSAVTDQILTKLGNLNFWNHNFFGTRQGKIKVKVRSKQGQGNIKRGSRPGQDKANVR